MSNIKTSFENTLYPLKLHVGPTASSPGPMLLKQDITADILEVMENPSMDISRKLVTVINVYPIR